MSYSAEVLADAPLAYWRLGEPSGTSMADSSGNSHAGSYVGSPTLAHASLLVGDPANTSVAFNGSSQYGHLASASWMNVNHLSAEAWIQLENGSPPDLPIFVSRGGGGFWNIGVDTASGEIAYSLGFGSVSALTSGAGITVGTSHHVVMTYDGTTTCCYVDGALLGSDGSFTGNLGAASAALDVGREASGGNYFPGEVDEVAIYNFALSSGRVSAHFTAGSTPSSVDASVAAPVATASAWAPVPVWTGTAPAGTDTTNFLNGRNRRARASVTVTRPVASAPSNLATKVDKAVPLPPPTLVDGRVT